MKLDCPPPDDWEDRTLLFIAYLVDQGAQSSTVKSYVSAIKKTLVNDKYKWDDSKIILSSITKACKIMNDKIYKHLPIHCGLLELLLFELKRILSTQPYLETLYVALFSLAYYGLFRVGELCQSDHIVKAANIHQAINKEKILVILYSLKMHGEESYPQEVKITSNRSEGSGAYFHRHCCPFVLLKKYITIRGNFQSQSEQFFVFSDGSPAKLEHARKILKTGLQNMGLDISLYGFHSFCVGRSTDLIKYGYTVEQVQRMGRWKSNVVYKYIRHTSN